MTAPRPSALFRTFLLAGHVTGAESRIRMSDIPSADAALLLDLANDPSIDPDSACGEATLLSAWLSNRPHLQTPFAFLYSSAARKSIEAVACALLDRGADGLLGLDRWLAGEIAPDTAQYAPRDTRPEAWLDAVLPCPMALAFATGCTGLLRRLVTLLPPAARADVLNRLRCADGRPLLHVAAACSHEMVEVLLEFDADPNLRDATGSTPLHAAASKKAVEALLSAGATESTRNTAGHTCRQVWMRTHSGTGSLLKDMLEALPVAPRRRSARDAVFMGVWSAAPTRLSVTLAEEGCAIPPVELAWMGVLSRMLGLLGADRVGTDGVAARLEKSGFAASPGHPGWLQTCFMAAAIHANPLPSMFSSVSRKERLSLDLFGKAGGQLAKAVGEMGLQEASLRAFRTALTTVSGDLPERLQVLSTSLARESQQPAHDVLVALFDAWGSSLVSCGVSSHLVELLAAAGAVYPEYSPRGILQKWAQSSHAFVGSEGLAPPTPADLRALCQAWAASPTEHGDTARLGNLFEDMFRLMQVWDRRAWQDAGGNAMIGCIETMATDSALAVFPPGGPAWASLAQRARIALAPDGSQESTARRPRQRA